MIELAQLRSFCAIVEHKSFTKAGEAVHRTQSTVSAQIALLEEAYGEPLLNRLPGAVTPTESGDILYDYAKRILTLIDESEERISDLKQVVSGNIVMGASTIPATYLLPGVIRDFREKHPLVHVLLRISNSKDVTSKIIDHTYAVGAVGEKTNDNRLEYIELAKDNVVLAVPPGHKWEKRPFVTLSDLPDEPYVSREQGSGTKAAVEKILKKKGFKRFNTVVEAGSTEAVKQSVIAGLGISFISEWAVKDSPLKSIKVKDLNIHRSFYIVFINKGEKSRAVQALIDFI